MSEDFPDEGLGPESSVQWLELFFDLVVVAAVAVLTDGLLEHRTPHVFGLFVLLYAALWLGWVSVVLYANVAGERTVTKTVILAMGLVAVMAAASPVDHPLRANAFAGAFIVLRGVVARASVRTGHVLAGWPLLQLGGALTPWVVAMWVPTPAKYVLWTLGLLIDLVQVLFRGDVDPQQQLARMRERLERETRRRGRDHPFADLDVVEVDSSHLDERLGLLIIIVLGEAVTQIVVGVTGAEWDRPLIVTAVVCFLILVGLWWLTFSYGFAAAPHTKLASMPARFGLPMHLATTLGIVCLASGLGALVGAVDSGDLGTWLRWLMCGGLALHFLVTTVGGYVARAPVRWVVGWGVPCTLLPLVLAAVGGPLSEPLLALGLLVPVAWMAAYGSIYA